MSKLPPGPKMKDIRKTLHSFRSAPADFILQMFREYGEIVNFKLPMRNIYFLWNPDDIKHVMQDKNKLYNKQTPGFKSLKELLGNGLVTSEGDFWLRQRRIAQPAFHRKRISEFADIMVENTESIFCKWDEYAGNESNVDITQEMLLLTLGIVTKALFNNDLKEFKELTVLNEEISNYLNARIYRSWNFPSWFPTPENIKFKKNLKLLDTEMYKFIEEQKQYQKEQPNFLSMLMHARDEETGEGMTDRQLRDESLTLLVAGHETSANALTWLWYLLSKHPDIAQKLYDEVDNVLKGRLPRIEDLPNLPLTGMIVKETLRLYPPAWVISRCAIEKDTIQDYDIPKGTIILVSPYGTHRHPKFWENPEGFNPYRFQPEKMANMSRFAYFPFGGGPRQCIGDYFATMEMQLIVATIAQRYELHLVPGYRANLKPLITLHADPAVIMSVHKRK